VEIDRYLLYNTTWVPGDASYTRERYLYAVPMIQVPVMPYQAYFHYIEAIFPTGNMFRRGVIAGDFRQVLGGEFANALKNELDREGVVRIHVKVRICICIPSSKAVKYRLARETGATVIAVIFCLLSHLYVSYKYSTIVRAVPKSA